MQWRRAGTGASSSVALRGRCCNWGRGFGGSSGVVYILCIFIHVICITYVCDAIYSTALNLACVLVCKWYVLPKWLGAYVYKWVHIYRYTHLVYCTATVFLSVQSCRAGTRGATATTQNLNASYSHRWQLEAWNDRWVRSCMVWQVAFSCLDCSSCAVELALDD